MIPWWLMLIPTATTVLFWLLWTRVTDNCDKAVRAIQLIEMEYRLMAQNTALFARLEELHATLAESRDVQMTVE